MEPHCSENHGPGQDSRVLVPSSLESTEYQPTAGEVMEMARVADNADPQDPHDQFQRDFTLTEPLHEANNAGAQPEQAPRLSPQAFYVQRPQSQHQNLNDGFQFGAGPKYNSVFKVPIKPSHNPSQMVESTPSSVQSLGNSNPSAHSSPKADGAPPIVPGIDGVPFPEAESPIHMTKDFASLRRSLEPRITPPPSHYPGNDGSKINGHVSPKDNQPLKMLTSDDFTPCNTMPPSSKTTTLGQQSSNKLHKESPQASNPTHLADVHHQWQAMKESRSRQAQNFSSHSSIKHYNEERLRLQEDQILRLSNQNGDLAQEVNVLDGMLLKLSDLYTKLQGQMKEKESDLASYEQTKKDLEAKAHKLQGFLKGLGNDYNHLQERTRSAQTQKDNLSAEERKEFARSHELVHQYCQQIESLKDTVAELKRERETRPPVHGANDPSTATPIANDQVKDLLGGMYDELKREHSDRCDELNSKLDTLLHKPDLIQPPPTNGQTNYTPMFQQCMGMIQQLVDRNYVQPQDIQDLDMSMQGYAQSIKQSLDASEKRSAEAIQIQQTLAMSVQKELSLLVQGTPNAQVLQEQLYEQREEKAAIKEQLSQANLKITETLCQANNYRDKDQEKSHIIQTLQTEAAVARNRPQEPAELLLRISDLQNAQRDLEAQKRLTEEKIEQMADHTQRKNSELERVRDEMAGLQLQAETAQAAQQELCDDYARLKEEAETSKLAERESAAKAAESRLVRVERQFENKEMELSSELGFARKKIQQLETELQQIDETGGAESAKVSDLMQQVVNLKNNLAQNQKESKSEIRRFQNSMQMLKSNNYNLETEVTKLLKERKEKETRIQAMKAVAETQRQEQEKFHISKTPGQPLQKRRIEESQNIGIKSLSEIARASSPSGEREPNSDEAFDRAVNNCRPLEKDTQVPQESVKNLAVAKASSQAFQKPPRRMVEDSQAKAATGLDSQRTSRTLSAQESELQHDPIASQDSSQGMLSTPRPRLPVSRQRDAKRAVARIAGPGSVLASPAKRVRIESQQGHSGPMDAIEDSQSPSQTTANGRKAGPQKLARPSQKDAKIKHRFATELNKTNGRK